MAKKPEPQAWRLTWHGRLFYRLGQLVGWIQSPFFFIRGFVRGERSKPKPK